MKTYSWSEFAKLTNLSPTRLGWLNGKGILKYRVHDGRADYRGTRYYTEDDLKFFQENFDEDGLLKQKECVTCGRMLPRDKFRTITKLYKGEYRTYFISSCRECENKANHARNIKNYEKRKVKKKKATTHLTISHIDWDRAFESLVDLALTLDIQVIFGTRITFAIPEILDKLEPNGIPEKSLNYRVLNYNGTFYEIAIRNNDFTSKVVRIHK